MNFLHERKKHSSLPLDIHSEEKRNLLCKPPSGTCESILSECATAGSKGAGLRELLALESGCMAQCSALLSSPCHLNRLLNVMVKFAQLGNEHVCWSQPDNEAD